VEVTPDGCETTFLNGVIEEEVYIEQPKWFEVEDRRIMSVG
jgi:hypothetical protein